MASPAPHSRTVRRSAIQDPRWAAVTAHLAALREQGRHAIRIVDADCGAGALLLGALLYARALGFTAIEGRGIEVSPPLVGRARASAARLRNPAIGVTFEVGDVATALRDEAEVPADLLLWHRYPAQDAPDVRVALSRAAKVVIDDSAAAADRWAA
ncbi:SAM-dependent methyltransferase [Sphingomonas desiccabilis]|uniref:SAM-dependent methyltransferase n=1 Tax=Sphingomonas desiccabilis TaxID=429134 RepID=A0A4Q2IL80_9SPHN|nr:SAM-dependent methyltransferase [Sphingomonas desiccabilis]